mmetsp:Transcript_44706/g.74022  ORF Transcript_44706/g.74022 Transcript_44706/m.74022 type:complete len:124 (-) Transcript_44706:54-425(-)
MNDIKHKLEQFQVSRAIHKMNAIQNEEQAQQNEDEGEEENRLKQQIEHKKQNYTEYYLALKKLKVEIEHIKNMLSKNRRQIQLDFETWWQQKQSSKHVITGDEIADENIAEFYKMRDEILKKL